MAVKIYTLSKFLSEAFQVLPSSCLNRMKPLIKSDQPPRNAVGQGRYFPSRASRQVHRLPQNTVADLHKCLIILLLQIVPQFLFLLKILLFLRPDTEGSKRRSS